MCDLPGVVKSAIIVGLLNLLSRSNIYGLPRPSADSLDPMDLYYALMFQDHPQKLLVYTYTRLLKQ